MLTTKLEHGELMFSNKLIYDLISSIIIEIPGVCRLKNCQISENNENISKRIKFRKNVIEQNSIDIKWDDNKNIYELSIYVILNDLHSIHVIAESIYSRIAFEFERQLKITNLNLKIYIEDFEDKF